MPTPRLALGLVLVAAGSIAGASVQGTLQAGELDPGFGVGGLVRTPFSTNAVGVAVAVQADGRIVMAGWTNQSNDPFPQLTDFAVARYLPTGALDPTFGSGGLVVTDLGRDDKAYSVVVRPDGRILVGGISDDPQTQALPFGKGYVALVQYTASGSPDPAFGADGRVITDPGAGSTSTMFGGGRITLALQPDGRVVAAGTIGFARVCPGMPFPSQFFDAGLFRYEEDGSPDPTFGGGDPVITDFQGGADTVEDVVVGADGGITVAGAIGDAPAGCGQGDPSPFLALARYTPAGILDPAFGDGGAAITTLEGRAETLALQVDGQIVVGGRESSAAVVGRFDAQGVLDSTFGTAGLAELPQLLSPVEAIVIQGDGKIVAVGEYSIADDNDQFGLARVDVNGLLDSSFGAGGYVATNFPETIHSEPDSVALQPDGKILVAGRSDSQFAVARYLGDNGGDVIQNGQFDQGMTGWGPFATPDMSYIVANVVNGVLEFYRLPPPPETTNEAVILQQTGMSFGVGAPIEAVFQLGNSSSVRKRISVLLHDSDFTDLFVCTFWLAPSTPLRTYMMRTHSTEPWANATVSFYAASTGSDGGAYLVDNVSVRNLFGGFFDATLCSDPASPAPPGGPDGPTMVGNGDFESGLSPWTTYGTITHQIASGVFEFVRPTPELPAGVVLQPTGQAVAANEILTAEFSLGNSSAVRKRVTVLLHDLDFTDLAACTFWLPPGQPLAQHRMRAYVTEAWTDATISVYAATVGVESWMQLDNVALQRTPSAAISGTECFEPSGTIAR